MRVARVARAVNVQIPVLDHFAISESKLCIWIRTFAFQTFKHIVTNAVFKVKVMKKLHFQFYFVYHTVPTVLMELMTCTCILIFRSWEEGEVVKREREEHEENLLEPTTQYCGTK